MFDAIQGVEFGYVLSGVIWAMTLGVAAGNYACSLVHRLPRGRLILDKTPYCGSCGTLLQVKDLFPVISGVMLGHRCRYCKEPYPVSHTWTEILVGLLFVFAYFKYNFSEPFLLIVLIGIFLITLAAIQANEKLVMGRILLCTMIFGLLFRVLMDNSLYPALYGALYGGIVGAVIWRKDIKQVAHIYTLPAPALLLVTGGICVGESQLWIFWALFAAGYCVDWVFRKVTKAEHGPLMTVSFGVATLLVVMYPELSSYLNLDVIVAFLVR